ncbi:MAG: hypothetical protein HYX82_01430 [Chloroflexi bacterium]|nr:hypothetical protein [Chloroflexota bacterium]
MTPTIRVDNDVMRRLQEEAVSRRLVFGTPNQVLRRVLGIDHLEDEVESRDSLVAHVQGNRQASEQVPLSHKPEVQAILDQLLLRMSKISTHCTLKKEGQRWVMRPNNFVALMVADKRESHVTVTVYGEPHLFSDMKTALDMKKDRASYSRFEINDKSQVHDAIAVIQRAYELKTER